MRVIGYLESSFWTMRPAEFGAMMRVAYAHAHDLDAVLASPPKPQAMMAKEGTPLGDTRYVDMRGDVAVIDLNGIIAKRMSLFEEICFGGTSTEILLKDFTTALNDPNVKAIVLNIDSPGGEAFGINELAQAIYDARGKKPIKAYISGLGCSGAYWIACAADEIITDKAAFLGSIGVVTAWADDTEFYKMMGIRREVVTSSNAPLKRLNFDNEGDRAELQRELDSMEKVFHKAVARNRKVSVEQVINDFNQGGVLAGADAVKAGMADRTGSLEEVIKELSTKQTRAATASASAEGDFDMGFKEEFKTFAAKIGFNVQDPMQEPGEEEPKDPKPVQDAAPAGEQADPPAPAEEQPAEEAAPATEAERVASLQREVAETKAGAFVSAEIAAGRMFPAEKETFTSLFIQAAVDDVTSPLATGSRVETLKANQAARKPHGLTEEVVDADANKVLLASGDRSDAEKKEDLLNKTPLGKAALKMVKGGKSATAASAK